MDIDSYVINLDRQPERYGTFVRANSRTGLTIERASASDGAQATAAQQESVAAPGLYFTPGAIGAALSHRALWQRTMVTGRPALILEDDVQLRGDIASALPQVMASIGQVWDVLLLGFNTDQDVKVIRNGAPATFRGYPPFPTQDFLAQFARARDPVSTYPLRGAYGICAYIVTPEGAARLLDLCFPMRGTEVIAPDGHVGQAIPNGLDGMMSGLYQRLGAYVCLPALAMTPNDQATSTTVGVRQKLSELMHKQRLSPADVARVLQVRPQDIQQWLSAGVQTRFTWGDGTGQPGLRAILQRWIDQGAKPTAAEMRAIAVPTSKPPKR